MNKPRPQHKLWSFDLMLGGLVVLTLTFFLLTIYNILQANVSFLLPAKATNFFTLKIMDTSSAASLFVTLLGALLVRHHFALGLLPHIINRSTNSTRKIAIDPTVTFETWRVEIQNSGLGPAIINSTEYILELPDAKNGILGTHQEITSELSKMGLIYDRDYWMENITIGFALSPKDNCFVFEIKMEHVAKIKRLDMVLYFYNQLGGKHREKIFLVPR